MEVHVNQDLYRHWVPLIHGGPELVQPYCFDGLLIQPHAEVTYQADVLRIPFRIDNQLNRNIALKIRPASFVCELRLNRTDDLRRTHASANAHQSAAVAAAAPWARADAATRANAAAHALAESRPAALSLRSQRDLRRLAHAEIGKIVVVVVDFLRDLN